MKLTKNGQAKCTIILSYLKAKKHLFLKVGELALHQRIIAIKRSNPTLNFKTFSKEILKLYIFSIKNQVFSSNACNLKAMTNKV